MLLVVEKVYVAPLEARSTTQSVVALSFLVASILFRRFDSIRFDSIRFDSIRFGSIRLDSIRGVLYVDGGSIETNEDFWITFIFNSHNFFL